MVLFSESVMIGFQVHGLRFCFAFGIMSVRPEKSTLSLLLSL